MLERPKSRLDKIEKRMTGNVDWETINRDIAALIDVVNHPVPDRRIEDCEVPKEQ